MDTDTTEPTDSPVPPGHDWVTVPHTRQDPTYFCARCGKTGRARTQRSPCDPPDLGKVPYGDYGLHPAWLRDELRESVIRADNANRRYARLRSELDHWLGNGKHREILVRRLRGQAFDQIAGGIDDTPAHVRGICRRYARQIEMFWTWFDDVEDEDDEEELDNIPGEPLPPQEEQE